jgi:hypothetical protein
MPEDVKASVEKAEKAQAAQTAQASQNGVIIRNLHGATNELKHATKRMNEALQSKQQHRAQWLQHLRESVQLWQVQLESYKKRQLELQEAAQQGLRDVQAARQSIDEHNALAGKTSAPAPTEETVDLTADDAEEEELKRKLQALLQQSAVTVGVETGFSSSGAPGDMQDISSDDGQKPAKSKRPRSAEPGM